ncbi:MAG: hypothetical protein LBG06_00310 [Deltaproteobacteria bacterium]|jgi:type IV pilus assembly protein PilY1|nr:hypothetical protein [Deltaproteobacteria bacterium]
MRIAGTSRSAARARAGAAAAALAAALLAAAPSLAGSPPRDKYTGLPFTSLSRSVPQILIVMSKDHKMFLQAYSNLTDLDGDGLIDVGFNPSITYFGYFDPESCYSYTRDRFERAGPADRDHPQAASPTRPPELSGRPDIAVPPSANGVCPGASDSGRGGLWHGNWLNYLATSQMDAIRKVLYGGKRAVDTAAETVLSASFTPRDCHVWGIETASDDLWAEKMRNMPYYDVSLYTAFTKPARGTFTFFARYQEGGGESGAPLIGVATRVKAGHRVPYFGTELRIWDWLTGESQQPYYQALPYGYSRHEFNAQVKVCDPAREGGISPAESCRQYPSGAWKPVGLLQEHGAESRMLFGLMTGTGDEDGRLHGGALRRHVESMSMGFDYATGRVRAGGVIDTLDRLRITGWSGSWYGDRTAWGSPLGEMMYEALRYFAGSPGALYAQRDRDPFGKVITDWAISRPGALLSSSCSQPVVILISHSYPDYDTDGFPARNPPELDALAPPPSSPAALRGPFDKEAYLRAIADNEGYGRGGRRFFYSRGESDDCSPKALASLGDVKGLCPAEPAREGGYATTAVAWYAHTRSLSPPAAAGVAASRGRPLELFAVSLPDTYPEISFDLGDGRSVSVLPAAETGRDLLLGFINYYVVDWQTDSTGLPFYIKIVANFEDAFEGSDFDRDALGTYEFSLLTTLRDGAGGEGTPGEMLEPQALRIHAGELKDPLPDQGVDPFGKGDSPTRYYRFKNYRAAGGGLDYSLPKITIDRSAVVGFSVTSDCFGSTTGGSQAVGYTVTGTTRDGTYMDVSHTKENFKRTATVDAARPWPNLSGVPHGFLRPNSMDKARLSPWSCLQPGGAGCGKGTSGRMTYYLTRGFRFAPQTSRPERLPSPLWLAAKYGGFRDVNGNGFPDPGEWERDPSAAVPEPANFFLVSNANELQKLLGQVFDGVGRKAAFGSGTAASLVADPRGGLSIQTIFYPVYDDPGTPGRQLPFLGSVFALFSDRWGNLREDTDRDGRLTPQTRQGKGDRIVTFTSVESPPESPPACHVPGEYFTRCDDPSGDNSPVVAPGREAAHPKGYYHLAAVWDAGRWLLELDDRYGRKITAGPRPWSSAATRSLGRRRVYYGLRNAGGKVFQRLLDPAREWGPIDTMILHDDWRGYVPGVNNRSEALTRLVNWVLGVEYPGLRGRVVQNPWNPQWDGVWRLGDVINSRPVAVGPPASNFDVLYGDMGYAEFRRKHLGRRQMAYFGANDGMLHAVNMGFGGVSPDGTVAYAARNPRRPSLPAHELGAEVWAYIPSSLMPKLHFLADPDFVHGYFVDLRPLVADVEIDGEWRTLLVGGVRFGGRPIEPVPQDQLPSRAYYGEVFCLDITDPEAEPKLMWTYSAPETGMMVGLPVAVKSAGRWYFLLPSGPGSDVVSVTNKGRARVDFVGRSPFEGVSAMNARVTVLDARSGRPAVDPALRPEYLRAPVPASFFGAPFLPMARPAGRGDWSNHAAYFGLTETALHGAGRDGGGVWRVQMADSRGRPLPVEDWKLALLLDTGRPVTGAVNGTLDAAGDRWIVFGTGRLYGEGDLAPCAAEPSDGCEENHVQYLFGVREPRDAAGNLTFADLTPSAPDLIDVSGATVFATGEVKGLPDQPGLRTGPGGSLSYRELEAAIRRPGVPGWKRRLEPRVQDRGKPSHEMSVTQPKLVALGGGRSLATITTFEPTGDTCGSTGQGRLRVIDTFTGLPRPETGPMFWGGGKGEAAGQEGAIPVAVGLGAGNPAEAVILEADGRIVIRAASADGGITDIELDEGSVIRRMLTSWREVLDPVLTLGRDAMTLDLEGEGK